eukprot:COSAG02_NODE_21_length_53083_cov_95.733618_1_plen_39_part_10
MRVFGLAGLCLGAAVGWRGVGAQDDGVIQMESNAVTTVS